MTPKEKALELWLKFRNELDFALDFDICRTYSRRVAILAVDEILKAVNDPDETFLCKDGVDYWSQVKQEIQNL